MAGRRPWLWLEKSPPEGRHVPTSKSMTSGCGMRQTTRRCSCMERAARGSAAMRASGSRAPPRRTDIKTSGAPADWSIGGRRPARDTRKKPPRRIWKKDVMLAMRLSRGGVLGGLLGACWLQACSGSDGAVGQVGPEGAVGAAAHDALVEGRRFDALDGCANGGVT